MRTFIEKDSVVVGAEGFIQLRAAEKPHGCAWIAIVERVLCARTSELGRTAVSAECAS